ncbi:LPXTG cell wall anchor domain-containing protein [Kitasatospora sp. NPDC054939]
MLRSLSLRAAAVVAASGLIAAPAVGPAFAADSSYTVQLRQKLPRTATTADGGAPQQGGEKCPGIPAGKDGWHFVLPGNDAHFVKLTVTFEPGGEQVVTTFGPPTDKHAYAASAPGAKLTSAVAQVRGGELDLFNLSHTCPAVVPSGTPSSPTTSATPSSSASPSASVTPSTSTSPSASVTPSATGSSSPSASTTPSQGASTGASPSAGTSGPAAGAPSASPSAAATGAGSGSLAATGASVGAAALAGAVLIGVGGVLVMRRRKAAAGQE